MTDSKENNNQIEIDSQMEEKKRKLHPRPECDELDNPLNLKRRKLTLSQNEKTSDEHSTHETEEELTHSEDANKPTNEIKSSSTPLKSEKRIISKSRSNLKSKSRSKSRSNIKFRNSSKKSLRSTSKLKEKNLTESSYCLRPRKNLDYSALDRDNDCIVDKLISCTGNPAETTDKSDDSDMSFKAESMKKISKCSKESLKKKSHPKEGNDEAVTNNEHDLGLKDCSYGAAMAEKKSENMSEEKENIQGEVDSNGYLPNNNADVKATEGEDSGCECDSFPATKDEILDEMRELQEEDILKEKEKYEEFLISEEMERMKNDSENI